MCRRVLRLCCGDVAWYPDPLPSVLCRNTCTIDSDGINSHNVTCLSGANYVLTKKKLTSYGAWLIVVAQVVLSGCIDLSLMCKFSLWLKWIVSSLVSGDLFDMLLPMLGIYQEYVRNHHYSLQVSPMTPYRAALMCDPPRVALSLWAKCALPVTVLQ